ncbi:hypothetical protein JVT61DRAFT_1611 [Boletus reticuloceps]|uniref:Uncharacterized protein n=1 Tax=Boletus reticuloceps TaxID=495285 RepID=A0A8I3A9A5_9AGAM|nr:hypothetical protein JVT61DRAFT_1611 [Boletus reticuloceps]
MDAWKQVEKEQKQQNGLLRETHRHAMELWVTETTHAKQEGQQPVLKKPKHGKLEGVIPKPKPNSHANEVEEMVIDEESHTSDSESDSGSTEA